MDSRVEKRVQGLTKKIAKLTSTFLVSSCKSSFSRHFVYGRRFENFFGYKFGTLGG